MNLESVSLLAILAATLAGMAVGALWYSPLLFAKPWMRAVGKTEADIQFSPRPFIVAAIAKLVMAFILSGLIFHMGGASVRTGVISAALIWVGFVATTIAVNHQFNGQPFALTLIDSGYWLAVLIVMGIVIGALGV